MGNLLPAIVDGGPSPRNVASTIVQLLPDDSERNGRILEAPARWRVLREGAISTQEISDYLAQQG